MKVFLDSNVWLSATLFPGLCDALLTSCAERQWLLTSPLVREEVHSVLQRKFLHVPEAPDLFDAIWREIPCCADAVDPGGDNDVRLVATADRAGAQFFVTGDRRVLAWQSSGPLRILSPRDTWLALFPADR